MRVDVARLTEYLGKPVVDPYGRRLGYVVGIYSDIDGKVVSLEVNFNDQEFREIPIDRFAIQQDQVVLLPEHEYKALLVENRLRIVKSRLASLEDLYAKKEIPTHAYEALKKKLESEIISVKTMAKEVRDSLRKRMHDVEEQMAEIERAMASLKTIYLAGEISEKHYVVALDMLKKSLEIFTKEKETLKRHIDLIESLEAMPSAPAIGLASTEKTTQGENQPFHVVVVE